MTRSCLEEVAPEILQQTHGHQTEPFFLSNARLFSVSALHVRRLLSEVADLYIGIASIPCLYSTIGEDAMVAIETCGYAAPVDGLDFSPSTHPARRRPTGHRR